MTKPFGMLARGLAVTITVGVALGLAGCGDEGASGSASNGNVVEESDTNAPLTRDEIISVTYGAAMEAGSAHLVMTMKGQVSTGAEGDVTYSDGEAAMKMTMSMPQMAKGKMEMRYVDQKTYLKLPGMTPRGKFIAIDPKDENSPLSKGFAGLTDQMDPLASVRSIESAVTSVERVGEAKVDGARTDHYRLAVDTARMMKGLKKPNPTGMPNSLSYDMWLDDDNLIRKMHFDVSGTQVEMLLSDWGQPVTVEPPAAGDIMKAPGA